MASNRQQRKAAARAKREAERAKREAEKAQRESAGGDPAATLVVDATKTQRTQAVASPKPTQSPSRTSNGPEAAVTAAEQLATKKGLSPTPATKTPVAGLDELKGRLAGVIEAYTVAIEGFDAREMAVLEAEEAEEEKKKALDQRANKLDEQQARAVEQKAAASQTLQEAKTERAALAPEREELDALRSNLVTREETVTAREIDADAGFIRRREEVLGELKTAHVELLSKNAELAAELEKARHIHTAERHEREGLHRERLETAEAALQTRRDYL
jgi:hypothetical protein